MEIFKGRWKTIRLKVPNLTRAEYIVFDSEMKTEHKAEWTS